MSEFESEELALGLLDRICTDLERAHGYRAPGHYEVARVEQARVTLASAPDRRWRLDEVARAVHCSPFHLARQFRRITGTSISRYLLRLRLALAMDRLASGATDLAGIASDLGFASHSHFTARFRSVFGTPPSSVRRALTSGELEELRTFVTAERRAAL